MDENGVINNAGILFFNNFPRKFFIQAYVTCARYLGNDKVKILDRKDFEGDLVSQIDEETVKTLGWSASRTGLRSSYSLDLRGGA